MNSRFSYIPYKETGYFSRLVTDYLHGIANIKPFYNYDWTFEGLNKAIADRANYPVNRVVLTDALRRQYAGLEMHPKVEASLALLALDNTYTVCAAHQPNLLTGYLYFVYKILHAIKLADELNATHPDKQFVPVYYMGSEDNDIEELGVFKFRGEKFVWDGDGQAGAVGRMNTAGLKTILAQLFKLLGPPGPDCDRLMKMFTTAYLKHKTVGEATHYLVNELFGKYGLIVLNPDDAALKAQFIPVMEDELLHQHANPIIAKQINALSEHYKIQAHPREINLFYLADQLRERIEQRDDKWVVLNSTIEWTKDEMLAELHAHPERFSPNVMLRGLYQETILPDVAFIGGGAEVAYWMQLNSLFAHYKVPFPVVYLRQSVMFIDAATQKLQKQLELSVTDIFMEEYELGREYIDRHSTAAWKTDTEIEAIAGIFHQLKAKAVAVDATLAPATEAALTKMKYQLSIMEKKMLRAEKKKEEVMMARIAKLKARLFPGNSLQERVDNFSELYLEYGDSFFDSIVEGIQPFEPKFLVISPSL